jgi:methionyl aminopeptidase
MIGSASVKTPEEIVIIKEATQISMQILAALRAATTIGTNAGEIDDLAGQLCKQHNVTPAFLGVGKKKNPFPANICVSINSEVLHAIPTREKVFKDGDLVKLDFGIVHQGYYTDHCITLGLGNVSGADQKLINIAKLAIESAANMAIAGAHVGDLGHTMQSIVAMAGFDVLKGFVGHGIGKSLHEEPEIAAYGVPNTGPQLLKNQVLCVEAQVVAGQEDVYVEKDGWTIKTADGRKSVMFEYMVLVGDKKPEILTDTRGWDWHVKP